MLILAILMRCGSASRRENEEAIFAFAFEQPALPGPHRNQLRKMQAHGFGVKLSAIIFAPLFCLR